MKKFLLFLAFFGIMATSSDVGAMKRRWRNNDNKQSSNKRCCTQITRGYVEDTFIWSISNERRKISVGLTCDGYLIGYYDGQRAFNIFVGDGAFQTGFENGILTMKDAQGDDRNYNLDMLFKEYHAKDLADHLSAIL